MNEIRERASVGTQQKVPVQPSRVRVVVLRPERGEAAGCFARRLLEALKAAGRPLLSLAFGSLEACQEFEAALAAETSGERWPLQWVEGKSCDGEAIAGVQTYVLEGEGCGLRRLVRRGRVLGSVWQDAGLRHCLLGGLGARTSAAGEELQAGEVFEEMETLLAEAGLGLGDVARTWFYNQRILEWYEAFNAVRNRHYRHGRFRIGSLPASTAVEGRHPGGSWLQLAAWALRPLEGVPECASEVASPLQCPAPCYGSAFSRAQELLLAGRRRLLVSGTASIEPGGRTVWRDDPLQQIVLSLEVVGALLQSRGMRFQDCDRAIVYCKDPAYLALFEERLVALGVSDLPWIAVHCDICRDDLLFEVELDAEVSEP